MAHYTINSDSCAFQKDYMNVVYCVDTIQMDSYAVRMDITTEVANKVRQAMNSKNQTISGLAKDAAIAYSTFHRCMNGGADFTMPQLGRIADALEVHPAEIMPDHFINSDAA